jgi:hypothetical protein
MSEGIARALSYRQNAEKKYGLKLSPSAPANTDQGITEEAPLASKASTQGSVQQKTAWKTPEGAAYSAQSRKSTLFDEDAPGVSTVSRDQ